MSGGHYNYAYRQVEEMADAIQEEGNCSAASPVLRVAFIAHLRLVAEAMKAIEWNDSGDGAPAESEKILACLPYVDGT